MLRAMSQGSLYLQGGGRMKAYRGTFVLAAVLLAALPLASCGDSDDWEKTTGITLTSNADSVVVKDEVIFTVTSTPPPLEEGYQCETLLEYRAEGAALDAYWVTVPGSGPTRVWALEPRRVEPFRVIARGKCADSKEDWKYSDQLDITVTEPPETSTPLPTVASLTLTASPVTVSMGTVPHDVTFTITATGDSGCTLHTSLAIDGATDEAQPATELPDPSGGLVTVTANGAGSVTGLAKSWCAENPSVPKTATATVTVTL